MSLDHIGKLILITFFVIIFIMILSTMGCTDAQWDANIGKVGDSAKIRCYSGGELIYQGRSTGAVKAAHQSDGWQFRERGSDDFKEVSGDCIINYDGED